MNAKPWIHRAGAKAWMCAAGLGFAAVVGAGCGREIVEAPPPPQTEVVTVAPEPEEVWIGGYWGWHWGHYTWIGGHWEHPAHTHAVWVQPRWEHRGGRYVFVEGYWR